ncbi:DNA recombination protein RmuC [Lacrimispora sp.]|uniref:DNA recombination protein RmuC n=1 Tax=Lacrimispora sp. TaxID=2719234 RepID=UPI0028A88F95|nr:DNA recombination protein RmuC [Lacrimispora sp.]
MTILIILCIIILVATIINIFLTANKSPSVDIEKIKKELLSEFVNQQTVFVGSLKNEILNEIRSSRTEMGANVQSTMKGFTDTFISAQNQTTDRQDIRLKELTDNISKNQSLLKTDIAEKLSSLQASQSESITALQNSVKETTTMLSSAQNKQFEMQDKRLGEISKMLKEAQTSLEASVSERLKSVDEQFKTFAAQNKESIDGIRNTVQERLESLRTDNNQQLEKMRATVDEKLQKTLDERITQSFKLVNDRLQEVYTGLGEMKTLATGVGDLKKVLSNVKTRGIVGEYQLGAIIEEILTKEQYDENVITKKGSANRVEYAIRLPGDDDGCVYLPIDAKFPGDTYGQLVDAYESGDNDAIVVAQAALEARIKGCAKDIHDKYIDPPYTTDFAIMFLPFEGLYAEVVRKGLIDTLQRQYRVNIAGPTTFAALLNSLQMGFRTLAIQKRSSEVWNVLGAVKTEFTRFETVLSAAQKRIEQTGEELDKLIGVRTRKINSKLREVAELPSIESEEILASAPELEEQ